MAGQANFSEGFLFAPRAGSISTQSRAAKSQGTGKAIGMPRLTALQLERSRRRRSSPNPGVSLGCTVLHAGIGHTHRGFLRTAIAAMWPMTGWPWACQVSSPNPPARRHPQRRHSHPEAPLRQATVIDAKLCPYQSVDNNAVPASPRHPGGRGAKLGKDSRQAFRILDLVSLDNHPALALAL